MVQQTQNQLEQLGPAERILGALTRFTDHLVHNRTGMVTKDANSPTGVKWEPVIWVDEEGQKVVYKPVKIGKKRDRVRVGVMNGNNEIRDGQTLVGEFRGAGLFNENVAYCLSLIHI